jgi:hypothetical protein
MLCAMRDTMRTPILPAAALLLALAVPRGSLAGDGAPWPQPLFAEPPVTSDGGHLMEGTATAPKWAWYSKIDVRWAYGAGVSDRAHQTRADLVFGLGLPARLEAALALPLGFTAGTHVVRDGVFALEGMGEDGPGIGDLRAALIWNAISAASGGFGLAFGAAAILPTGDHERLLGEGGFGGEAFASFALHLLGSRFGANLGYRLRPEHVVPEPGARFEQDDDVIWRVGLRVPRENDVAWSIEAAGAIGVATSEGVWPEAGSRPVWFGGGVDFPVGKRNRLGALAGFGVGEAAPLFTFALRLTTIPVSPDEDADGVSGGSDECALFPEDHDGFEDGDGCPDGDNDADGFPDDEDACPDTAAGGESEDGC